MSRVIVIDFVLGEGESGFTAAQPIGVILENDSGGVDIRYRDEAIESDSSPVNEAYMSTMLYLERWLQAWRSGEAEVDWEQVLTKLADSSYLSIRYRNISRVGDEMTIEDAYETFVVEGEPLPIVPDEELSDV